MWCSAGIEGIRALQQRAEANTDEKSAGKLHALSLSLSQPLRAMYCVLCACCLATSVLECTDKPCVYSQ